MFKEGEKRNFHESKKPFFLKHSMRRIRFPVGKYSRQKQAFSPHNRYGISPGLNPDDDLYGVVFETLEQKKGLGKVKHETGLCNKLLFFVKYDAENRDYW